MNRRGGDVRFCMSVLIATNVLWTVTAAWGGNRMFIVPLINAACFSAVFLWMLAND